MIVLSRAGEMVVAARTWSSARGGCAGTRKGQAPCLPLKRIRRCGKQPARVEVERRLAEIRLLVAPKKRRTARHITMRSEKPLASPAPGSREPPTPATMSTGTASRIPTLINVSWQVHNDLFMHAARTLALPASALQFTASESNTTNTYWRCIGADVRVGGAAGGARARGRAVSRMRARAGAQRWRLRAVGGGRGSTAAA